jgi:LCP family protein required for cell wall assembly
MHEHKKFSGPSRRPKSIDGIVSDGRSLGVPNKHRSYQPNRAAPTPTLDSLTKQQSDGFHPMWQSAVDMNQDSSLDNVLDEPIVLDEPATKGHRHRKKGKQKKHPKLRKFMKRTALMAGILLISVAGYLGYKFYHTQKKVLSGGGQAPAVCDGQVPLNQLKKEGDGRVNILLMGIGGDGHDGPDLTDTIMVASLDPETDKMDLLSIPRDLWVKIPGDGSRKINEAYYYGKTYSKATDADQKKKDGIKSADQTVENVLGVKIHYNAVVDFKAFQDIVNALGGVDINITDDLAVKETLWVEGTSQHYTLNVQPGMQHFDGTRALYFARSRHTSARGDFDRAERQRALIVAIKEKALSAGTFTNPLKVSQLLDSLGDNVYTDFDSGSLKCLYQQISEVPASSIVSTDLVTPPHDLLASGYVAGLSTLAPKAGLYNYGAIQTYVHTTFRDGFLAKENAETMVYNATDTAGLATSQANTLKEYGYNVTKVDSLAAPTNPDKTVVVDLSKGKDKYTRNYLEQRYGVTAVTKLPAGVNITPSQTAKFVIILGNDVASTAN